MAAMEMKEGTPRKGGSVVSGPWLHCVTPWRDMDEPAFTVCQAWLCDWGTSPYRITQTDNTLFLVSLGPPPKTISFHVETVGPVLAD